MCPKCLRRNVSLAYLDMTFDAPKGNSGRGPGGATENDSQAHLCGEVSIHQP